MTEVDIVILLVVLLVLGFVLVMTGICGMITLERMPLWWIIIPLALLSMSVLAPPSCLSSTRVDAYKNRLHPPSNTELYIKMQKLQDRLDMLELKQKEK